MSLGLAENYGVASSLGVAPLYGVDGAPAQPTFLFTSAWTSGTGSGDTAVEDTGRWTRNGSNDARQTVQASTGLDFPTTNVYRTEFDGTNYAVNKVIVAGEIPEGTTLYRRLYWRFGLTSGVNPGSSNHPIESTNSTTLNVVRPLAWEMTNSEGGAPFDCRWLASYDNGVGFPARAHRWRVTLEPDTTYRLEWAMTRLADSGGEGNWDLHARIYDTSDVLLFTDSDFICTNSGHGNHTLADTSPSVWTTAGDRTEAISGTAIGYQGGYTYAGEYIYYGGFAASTDDWCGAYVNGEAP